jgi:hypothetical protein
MQHEGFQYVAGKTYQERTGQTWIPCPKAPPRPRKPAGENWDFENQEEGRRRLPKLYARATAAAGQ